MIPHKQTLSASVASLLALLLTLSVASGAITEWYVTDAGAGSGAGTSEANAMSFATLRDYMETGGSVNASAGARFNIKGAITGGTSALTWANGGTSTSPVVLRGYGTTITDGYQGRTNGNGALVTTNMPGITFTSTGKITFTAAWIICESLNINGAVAGNFITLGNTSTVVRCKINSSGTSTFPQALFLGITSSAIDCDLSCSGAGAYGVVEATSLNVKIVGCRITGTATRGIISGSTSIADCTIFDISGTGGVGIYANSASSSMAIIGNTIVGCTSDGIILSGTNTSQQLIVNNCITDNGGYGINMVSAAASGVIASNRMRDNTSGSINLGTDWVAATSYGQSATDTGTTGTTATDYVNYAGKNYNLIPTSPATSAGFPLYRSIGALQLSQTGGSSSSSSSFTFAQ
jgi:hypothetical protein